MHTQYEQYNDKDPYHTCINQNISNPYKTTCISYINGKLPLKQRKLGSQLSHFGHVLLKHIYGQAFS